MNRKNIVIAPCGNSSNLFASSWLKQKERDFDLCLIFYHENINNPELYKEADFFFHLKDFKYFMLYKLFTDIQPDWLDKYKYFYFIDDDVEIDTDNINSLFKLSAAFGSWISQASLTKDSYCSWPMFKQQPKSFCRFVGQIEVMAPLFEKEALKKCLSCFIGNRSSWGVDSVWSKLLGYPQNKLIVFDNITMRHTKPVGGGELYQKIGIDPQEDWLNIVSKYNAKKHNYQEYGRLTVVNIHSNRIQFASHKLKELAAKSLQAYNDYDLPSRINNRITKIFKR